MIDKRVAMTSRYDGTCCACGNKIRKGKPILWNPGTRDSWHETCKNRAKSKKKKKKKGTAGLAAARPPLGSVRFFRF